MRSLMLALTSGAALGAMAATPVSASQIDDIAQTGQDLVKPHLAPEASAIPSTDIPDVIDSLDNTSPLTPGGDVSGLTGDMPGLIDTLSDWAGEVSGWVDFEINGSVDFDLYNDCDDCE